MKLLSFGKLGTSLFPRDPLDSDSSADEDTKEPISRRLATPNIKLSTKNNVNPITENGSVSAIDAPSADRLTFLNGNMPDQDSFLPVQRRHTLSTITSVPPRSSHRTPSGRKKRSSSSSVRSFFNLTQSQATLRKWLYAAYVYVCVAVIILVGIREYVQRFALDGNEAVGWALGYLFGDIPRFRMEVITANLQRWICLPPRSGLENEESCHLGWVEHLRHASFGEANTRLILCGYWLAIIIVGLAIVFRLSSIYEVDTRRKVFHFMMVAMLLPATYVDPTFAALALSLMLAIFLLLDLFRASQLPPLSKSLAYFLTPYVDGRDLKGPVVISHIFLLIGCAIPLWLSLGTLPRTGAAYLSGWEVPTRELSMVSGVICVGMGDAAASLIGRRFGRRKWIWGGGKSIEGSVAFATAVGLALVLAKAWLRIGGWPANNADTWVMTIGKSGVAAGVASLTEAVLTGGNDNVVVPVVLWLSVKGLDI
jgi:dolichol kinase